VQIKPNQSYAALASINNRAQVWIPSQADSKWEARVVFTEPVGNADQGTVTVELSLQNNIPELYPGQLVSVQLFGDLQPQVIIIPEVCLSVQQGKSGVWVVQNGRAHFMEVQVGLQTPDGALINVGLQNGDVVLQPAGLHEGQRVIPQITGSQ
jgi:HlyD family secretion protein